MKTPDQVENEVSELINLIRDFAPKYSMPIMMTSFSIILVGIMKRKGKEKEDLYRLIDLAWETIDTAEYV